MYTSREKNKFGCKQCEYCSYIILSFISKYDNLLLDQTHNLVLRFGCKQYRYCSYTVSNCFFYFSMFELIQTQNFVKGYIFSLSTLGLVIAFRPSTSKHNNHTVYTITMPTVERLNGRNKKPSILWNKNKPSNLTKSHRCLAISQLACLPPSYRVDSSLLHAIDFPTSQSDRTTNTSLSDCQNLEKYKSKTLKSK